MPIDQELARTAAEQANKLFGQWMPERWLNLFIDSYDDIEEARGDGPTVLLPRGYWIVNCTFGLIRKMWRSIWFMDDDDITPQGKLARGTFYLVYAFFGYLILFGAIVPTIDYACHGCLGGHWK